MPEARSRTSTSPCPARGISMSPTSITFSARPPFSYQPASMSSSMSSGDPGRRPEPLLHRKLARFVHDVLRRGIDRLDDLDRLLAGARHVRQAQFGRVGDESRILHRVVE